MRQKTYITEDEAWQHILDVQEGLHKDGISCPDLVSVAGVNGTPDLARNTPAMAQLQI